MVWHIAVGKKGSRWKVEVSCVTAVTAREKSLLFVITQ